MTSTPPACPNDVAALARAPALVAVGSYFLLTGALLGFVPLRVSALGADGAVLGTLLVLAGGGIGLVTDMFFATYADDRGRDRVVFWGFACIFVAVLLLALDKSIVGLFVGCSLAGLGNSAVFDPALALLTTARHHHSQARTQGLNASVQRGAALLAALMLGTALATRQDEVLTVTAGVACTAPLLAFYSRRTMPLRHWLSLWKPDGPRRPGRLVVGGYRRGLGMLRRRRIVLAALVSVAVNLIFIETNSFVVLLDRHHGAHQAFVVTAALAARDLVAVAVGIFTVATGRDLSSSKVVVPALCVAGLGAFGIGLGSSGSHLSLILWCAVQGAAIGIGVATMNLLTVSGSQVSQRALAMAAATLISRAGIVVIPIGLGFTMQLAGLEWVFFLIGGALVLFSLAFLVVSLGLTRRVRSGWGF
jgi:MFS family permease